MKINSKDLWEYINELAINEKVKLNVYYDDRYVTQIYWNGKNFEWKPGKFTSEAFFNPLYDFIVVEEQKKIPEKLNVIAYEKCIHEVTHKEKQLALEIRETQIAFNEIIDYLKSKGQ